MYLTKKLKQVEEQKGISSPSELSELLINGITPSGVKISERQRKELINIICGVIYETANEIKHIQNIIND